MMTPEQAETTLDQYMQSVDGEGYASLSITSRVLTAMMTVSLECETATLALLKDLQTRVAQLERTVAMLAQPNI